MSGVSSRDINVSDGLGGTGLQEGGEGTSASHEATGGFETPTFTATGGDLNKDDPPPDRKRLRIDGGVRLDAKSK